jgi:hypothetical protein
MPKAVVLSNYRPTTVNGTLKYLLQEARDTPTLERSAAQHALLRDTALAVAVHVARQALANPQNANMLTVCRYNLLAARTAYTDNQQVYTPLLNAHLIDAYYHNQALDAIHAQDQNG